MELIIRGVNTCKSLVCKRITSQSGPIKTSFRIVDYAVTSTPSSVIYFGGYDGSGVSTDKVVEYRNLQWTLLGNLAGPRDGHRSIKMENKIYLFGGWDTT